MWFIQFAQRVNELLEPTGTVSDSCFIPEYDVVNLLLVATNSEFKAAAKEEAGEYLFGKEGVLDEEVKAALHADGPGFMDYSTDIETFVSVVLPQLPEYKGAVRPMPKLFTSRAAQLSWLKTMLVVYRFIPQSVVEGEELYYLDHLFEIVGDDGSVGCSPENTTSLSNFVRKIWPEIRKRSARAKRITRTNTMSSSSDGDGARDDWEPEAGEEAEAPKACQAQPPQEQLRIEAPKAADAPPPYSTAEEMIMYVLERCFARSGKCSAVDVAPCDMVKIWIGAVHQGHIPGFSTADIFKVDLDAPHVRMFVNDVAVKHLSPKCGLVMAKPVCLNPRVYSSTPRLSYGYLSYVKDAKIIMDRFLAQPRPTSGV
jgi:hypothetical protein